MASTKHRQKHAKSSSKSDPSAGGDVLIINTKDNGVLDATPPERVREIARQIAESDRVVIHIHGGLVKKKDGIEKAQLLSPYYKAKGLLSVFPVWESGLFEQIIKKPAGILEDPLFQSLFVTLGTYVGTKLQCGEKRFLEDQLKEALAQARKSKENPAIPEPMAEVIPKVFPSEASEDEQKKLGDELAADPDFRSILARIAARVAAESSGKPGRVSAQPGMMLSKEIKAEILEDSRSPEKSRNGTRRTIIHVVKIFVRIMIRYRKGTDHGFWCTIVEEYLRELHIAALGQHIWGNMKNDTAATFGEPTGEPRGGQLLLASLAEAIAARVNANRPLPQVSLVGHSAGAIWALHFLQHVADLQVTGKMPREFRVHRVVFLAPACTDDLLAEKISQPAITSIIDGFRMYALSDELESGYWEVPLLYPCSLLYAISGLLEPSVDQAITGMQRYVTREKIYHSQSEVAVRNFLKPANASVWALASDGNGLNCDATTHGAFTHIPKPPYSDSKRPAENEEVLTMQSVVYFLLN